MTDQPELGKIDQTSPISVEDYNPLEDLDDAIRRLAFKVRYGSQRALQKQLPDYCRAARDLAQTIAILYSLSDPDPDAPTP